MANGEWLMENGTESGVERGEWKTKNGARRMENKEWSAENGKQGMENREWRRKKEERGRIRNGLSSLKPQRRAKKMRA
jgi:hypothetical protein